MIDIANAQAYVDYHTAVYRNRNKISRKLLALQLKNRLFGANTDRYHEENSLIERERECNEILDETTPRASVLRIKIKEYRRVNRKK